MIEKSATLIASARDLRDAFVRGIDQPQLRLAYKTAHQAAPVATHEQAPDGNVVHLVGELRSALIEVPDATLAFLNLSCDPCTRNGNFAAAEDGAVKLIYDTSPSDEELLRRAIPFLAFMRDGRFDGEYVQAKALANEPQFDELIVHG